MHIIPGNRFPNLHAIFFQPLYILLSSILFVFLLLYLILSESINNLRYYLFNTGPIKKNHDRETLTKIAVNKNTTSLEVMRFSHNRKLVSITLPHGLRKIKGYAFNGCKALASITLPDSVTTVGLYPFYNCRNLKTITAPQHLDLSILIRDPEMVPSWLNPNTMIIRRELLITPLLPKKVLGRKIHKHPTLELYFSRNLTLLLYLAAKKRTSLPLLPIVALDTILLHFSRSKYRPRVGTVQSGDILTPTIDAVPMSEESLELIRWFNELDQAYIVAKKGDTTPYQCLPKN